MQTAVSLRSLRPACRLVAASRQRGAMVPAARRYWASPRCEEAEKKDVPAAAGRQSERAVAPARQSMGLAFPSFNRMSQVMHDMEREMESMSRAFGMPSMFGPSLFEAPELPAMSALTAAKSLAVDIKDTGSEIQIHADVPGMTKDDIKVQVSPDRVLTISGERKSEHKEGSEEEGSLRIERSYGQFMRRFRLPDNVDTENIKAVTKDGELRLSIPKVASEEAKPKEIPVATE